MKLEIFRQIHHLDTVESTNATLKKMHHEGAKIGTAVIARTQTKGRGRGEHAWHSPAGGVYLSALLAPSPQGKLTDLTLVAGVAMAQAVRDALPKAVEVGLKWPNDCLLNWKKVGGILCEGVTEGTAMAVVGMGINANLSEQDLAPFVSNPFSATSFTRECPGTEFDVSALAQTLLRKLENIYLSYLQKGFEPVRYLWERNCAFVGKKVEVRLANAPRPEANAPAPTANAAGQATVSGVFLGIDEQGAMVLATGEQGERTRVVSGEVICCLR